MLAPGIDSVDLAFPESAIDADGASGEVLVVDDFGNAVTNVPGDVLEGLETVEANGEPVPVVRSYAHVEPGTRVATVGSHGNVELAVNRGRGDEAFDVGVGDGVVLEWE